MTPLMTVKEAAAFLNLSPFTIYRAVEAGTLPHVRIGRSIRISQDAIESLTFTPSAATNAEEKTVTRTPVTRL